MPRTDRAVSICDQRGHWIGKAKPCYTKPYGTFICSCCGVQFNSFEQFDERLERGDFAHFAAIVLTILDRHSDIRESELELRTFCDEAKVIEWMED